MGVFGGGLNESVGSFVLFTLVLNLHRVALVDLYMTRHGIWALRSGIWDLGSEIRDLESGI